MAFCLLICGLIVSGRVEGNQLHVVFRLISRTKAQDRKIIRAWWTRTGLHSSCIVSLSLIQGRPHSHHTIPLKSLPQPWIISIQRHIGLQSCKLVFFENENACKYLKVQVRTKIITCSVNSRIILSIGYIVETKLNIGDIHSFLAGWSFNSWHHTKSLPIIKHE